MAIIRTVLGDKNPTDFGVTLIHEHTIFHFMGAKADPKIAYEPEEAVEEAVAELCEARTGYGLSAILDASPFDLGRDRDLQVEISRRSGVDIIACTGMFTESLGFPTYWRQRNVDALEELFTAEITEGIGNGKAKCGVIKVACGPGFLEPRRHAGELTPSEERAFKAAARVQREIGVPIITHTEPEDWQETNIGLKQLELLEEAGADVSRCMIGHVTNTANLDYLVSLLRRGVNIGFDTIGLNWAYTDDIIAGLVLALIGLGYERQLLLSHDRYCKEVRREVTEEDPSVYSPPIPDLGHIHRTFLPRLAKGGVGEDTVHQILVENPRRLLAF